MLAPTGRFTTFVAGAAVLVVISVAFFVVFDLNTALGSSAGLPVVEIGNGAPFDESEVTDAQQPSEATESAISIVMAADSGDSGVPPQPTQTGGSSQSFAATVGTQDDGTSVQTESTTREDVQTESTTPEDVQTDSTTREYVQEEVQVKGRRPDPKTEHPGRGVGLLNKSKD